MVKIVRLTLSIAAAQPAGYALTAALYLQGDRAPTEVQEYQRLSHYELETLVSDLANRWRPGWEYAPLAEQPSLFQD